MATKNARSIRDHVCAEVDRRYTGRDAIDTTRVEIIADGAELVLRGMVDDAFARVTVQRVATELLGVAVRSELGVREDIAAEAAAKTTEFGSSRSSRATSGRRGLPS